MTPVNSCLGISGRHDVTAGGCSCKDEQNAFTPALLRIRFSRQFARRQVVAATDASF